MTYIKSNLDYLKEQTGGISQTLKTSMISLPNETYDSTTKCPAAEPTIIGAFFACYEELTTKLAEEMVKIEEIGDGFATLDNVMAGYATTLGMEVSSSAAPKVEASKFDAQDSFGEMSSQFTAALVASGLSADAFKEVKQSGNNKKSGAYQSSSSGYQSMAYQSSGTSYTPQTVSTTSSQTTTPTPTTLTTTTVEADKDTSISKEDNKDTESASSKIEKVKTEVKEIIEDSLAPVTAVVGGTVPVLVGETIASTGGGTSGVVTPTYSGSSYGSTDNQEVSIEKLENEEELGLENEEEFDLENPQEETEIIEDQPVENVEETVLEEGEEEVQEEVVSEKETKGTEKKDASGTILKAVGATMMVGSATGAGLYYKKEKEKEEEEEENNEDDEIMLDSEDDLLGGVENV